jgi:hypothetical protein
MRSNSTYNLHTTKQMIDINQSVKNFKARIKIQGQNEDDKFYVLVVTSDDLDDNLDEHYKEVKHEVTINLESDDKHPDADYVLIMKSNNLIKVNVSIDLVDLNDTLDNNNSTEDFQVQSNSSTKSSYLGMVTKHFTKRNMMIIAVLVIGILVYFFVIKKKDDKSTTLKMESEPPAISISEEIESDCAGEIGRERSVRERSVRESDCAGASTLKRLQRLRDCN